jgi:hypothetical protein
MERVLRDAEGPIPTLDETIMAVAMACASGTGAGAGSRIHSRIHSRRWALRRGEALDALSRSDRVPDRGDA